MVLVASVLTGGASITYTAHQQRISDRRWCSLLASIDQPAIPATTERGRVVQQQIHQLRHDLGCKGA